MLCRDFPITPHTYIPALLLRQHYQAGMYVWVWSDQSFRMT